MLTSLLVVLALVSAHVFLPAGRPGWRKLWPGIVATLTLWVVSGWVFAVYLRRFSNLAATYAGLASVVSAIFFLYVAAAVMIFGGELQRGACAPARKTPTRGSGEGRKADLSSAVEGGAQGAVEFARDCMA